MSIYAIGDVQGCYGPLLDLLDRIPFSSNSDQLWFVGDLVNRGPDSLRVLRFIRDLGDQAQIVLGNHDLHLLALAHGIGRPRRLDTFHDVLHAPDRDELLHWLAGRPLMHYNEELNFAMVHAGLAPQWDLDTALACAREGEGWLQQDNAGGFYDHMYGNYPHGWDDRLTGWERIRFIVNCFTRIRFCDRDGNLLLKEKGKPTGREGLLPWFEMPGRRNRDINIVFGHWSTLGWYQGHGVSCLDTGCIWGGRLTALCLDEPERLIKLEC